MKAVKRVVCSFRSLRPNDIIQFPLPTMCNPLLNLYEKSFREKINNNSIYIQEFNTWSMWSMIIKDNNNILQFINNRNVTLNNDILMKLFNRYDNNIGHKTWIVKNVSSSKERVMREMKVAESEYPSFNHRDPGIITLTELDAHINGHIKEIPKEKKNSLIINKFGHMMDSEFTNNVLVDNNEIVHFHVKQDLIDTIKKLVIYDDKKN